MLTVLALAVVAFVSTNIDDAFVLVGFFSDARLRTASVVAGQFLGIASLTAAAIAFSLLTFALPDRDIGLLGILPVLIGLWHLWKALRANDGGEAHPPAGFGAILSVATVTVANGGDNIAVYVPLFSRQTAGGVLAICAVFAAMTALWCAAGAALVGHPRLGAPLRRWGSRIMPLVLIGLGAFILVSSGAL
ncbi:MAG TPA: cadmium resistance transporter [Rhizomicrobium sp.]|jgi:cadmium resistance protein CadD (predicted permease)